MAHLKNFTQLNSDEVLATFIARSHPSIACFLTNTTPNYEAHKNYINYLKNQSDKRYFMVFDDDDFMGVILFTSIKTKEGEAEFGLYKNPRMTSVGNLLMQALLDYAKNELKLKRLYGRVKKKNIKAIKLYTHFGFSPSDDDEEEDIIFMDKKL